MMKKLLLTILPVVLLLGITAPSAHAVTLDELWAEVVSLRNEVTELKSQLQPVKPVVKKTLKKKVTKSTTTTSSIGTTTSVAGMPPGNAYDIYAVAFNTAISKMQLWALDASENLIMVGTMDNSCPFYSAQSLAMDSNGNLYFNKNTNAGQGVVNMHSLTCDNSGTCSCGPAQPNNVPGATVVWGSAVINNYANDQLMLGINAGTTIGTNGSSIAMSPLGSASWTPTPLMNPNGSQFAGLLGDIVQIGPDTIMINSGGNNINSFTTMVNPGLGNPQNIGSAGVKIITGLASKKVGNDTIVYSFTNLINNKGRVWKHVLAPDLGSIVSSTEIAQLPSWTAFHDAASKPYYQPPLAPPPPVLPDLITSDLTFYTCCPFTPSVKWQSSAMEVGGFVTTKNNGPEVVVLPTGYHIGIYLNSVGASNKTAGVTLTQPVTLQPGQTYVRNFGMVAQPSMFPAPGTYTMVAKTDTWEGFAQNPVNNVVESDENNNELAKPLLFTP